MSLQKPSVLELKNNPQAFVDYKFRRDALLGLERCAGEVITDILNLIETGDPDEAQMRIVLRGKRFSYHPPPSLGIVNIILFLSLNSNLFHGPTFLELPTFADYFQQLRTADAAFASQCASHWKSFLAGPPNHPNEDDYGMIELTCGFITACEVGVSQFFAAGALMGF